MIRHVFLWKLAPGQSLQPVIDVLNTLPDRCPGSWAGRSPGTKLNRIQTATLGMGCLSLTMSPGKR